MNDPENREGTSIELDGDGYTAVIAAEDWLMIGAPVQVAHPPRQGPWHGRVLAFGRATRSLAEWHLATGERREARLHTNPEDGFVTGQVFPVQMGPNRWDARVIHHEPVIRVTVNYTIQSGAVRRRDLFHPGELTAYAKPTSNGQVAIVVPRHPPASTPPQPEPSS